MFPARPAMTRSTFLRIPALAVLALGLAGCPEHFDPTQIYSPPAPLAHGVTVTAYFQGNDANTPVVNEWVSDSTDTWNVKTLLATNGGGQYGPCIYPNLCPCQGPVVYLTPVPYPTPPGTGDWALFCQQSMSRAAVIGPSATPGFLTDGNSSATRSYPFRMPIYFQWDWQDYNNIKVVGVSYNMHIELAGYYYGNTPAEAWVTVLNNGFSGSAMGTVDGGGRWLQISATWNP